MLVLSGFVSATFDRVAVAHEFELGDGEGVTNATGQLLGAVPAMIAEHAEQPFGLGLLAPQAGQVELS